MDRELAFYGLLGMLAAVDLHGDEIARRAVIGADIKNKDVFPLGRVVRDPAWRGILDELGIDPDIGYYPLPGSRYGEYSLNELVEVSGRRARKGLGVWLPEGKGTERGVVEVGLVNQFVDEFFPLVSDPGAEWEYKLGPDQLLVHDILNEDLLPPDDLSEEELLTWCEFWLEKYRGGGRGE
jgi:hypothetical protein